MGIVNDNFRMMIIKGGKKKVVLPPSKGAIFFWPGCLAIAPFLLCKMAAKVRKACFCEGTSMESSDVLGDIGREYIKACVKVKIFNRHKVREYTQDEAIERVNACLSKPITKEQFMACVQPQVDKKEKETFSIIEIKHAINLLEKDSLEGDQSSDEMKSRRDDVTRERTEYLSHSRILMIGIGIGSGMILGPLAGVILACICANIIGEKKPSGQQGIVSEDVIEYGTGFIVDRRFFRDPRLRPYYDYIMTCKHVIEAVLGEQNKGNEVRIWNEVFDDLPCTVVAEDGLRDLALLCCRDLKLNKSNIPRFELSCDVPKTGQSIFSFGYPITSTYESAFFSNGYVAATRKPWGELNPIFLVLDSPATSHGCSGGPVMQWIKGEIKVVAALKEKLKKDILPVEELERFEHMRSSFSTSSITDSQNLQEVLNALLLKMFDGSEVRSPFNNCTAMPVGLVEWKFLD